MRSDLRISFDQIGFGVERREPYLLPAPHAHADVEMILTERGSIEHLLGGRRMACGAGELVMFWAGVPHQSVSVVARTRCFFVHFPVAWLLAWPLSKAFVRPLLQGRVMRWPGAPNAAVAARFREWHGEASTLGPDGPGIMRLELQALVQRLAVVANPGPGHGDADPARLVTVDAIAAYVVQHYTRPLTAAQIGRVVGVHPNHAMRAFSQAFGIPLWTYVGRLRVAHARHLLSTTDRKVTQVGLEAGFTSVGRFYDVFRRETGMAPKEYRVVNRGFVQCAK
jgi:AraC-like DNA-binding protein